MNFNKKRLLNLRPISLVVLLLIFTAAQTSAENEFSGYDEVKCLFYEIEGFVDAEGTLLAERTAFPIRTQVSSTGSSYWANMLNTNCPTPSQESEGAVCTRSYSITPSPERDDLALRITNREGLLYHNIATGIAYECRQSTKELQNGEINPLGCNPYNENPVDGIVYHSSALVSNLPINGAAYIQKGENGNVVGCLFSITTANFCSDELQQEVFNVLLEGHDSKTDEWTTVLSGNAEKFSFHRSFIEIYEQEGYTADTHYYKIEGPASPDKQLNELKCIVNNGFFQKDLQGSPSCGNGIIEDFDSFSEECDSGLGFCSINPNGRWWEPNILTNIPCTPSHLDSMSLECLTRYPDPRMNAHCVAQPGRGCTVNCQEGLLVDIRTDKKGEQGFLEKKLSLGDLTTEEPAEVNNRFYSYIRKDDGLKCIISHPRKNIIKEDITKIKITSLQKDDRITILNIDDSRLADLSCSDGCTFTLDDAEVETVREALPESSPVTCEVEFENKFFPSQDLYLIKDNIKDELEFTKEGAAGTNLPVRQAFLVSDKDWRSSLQYIPATLWPRTNEGWCQLVHNPFELGTTKEMCGYPLITYLSSGNNGDLYATAPAIILQGVYDEHSKDYVNAFLVNYEPDRIISIEDSGTNLGSCTGAEWKDQDSSACKVLKMVRNKESEALITKSDYWKDLWKSTGFIIAVSHNDYKGGLFGAQLAHYFNAPLVFVGEENKVEWQNYLRGKLVAIIGELNCEDCLKEIKEENIIIKYNLEDQKLTFNEEQVDPLYEDRTFIDYLDVQVFLKNLIGNEDKTVLTNPNDLLQAENFGETIEIANIQYPRAYAQESLLTPYLAAATDSIIRFYEPEAPAPGNLILAEATDTVLRLQEQIEKNPEVNPKDEEILEESIGKTNGLIAISWENLLKTDDAIENAVLTTIDLKPRESPLDQIFVFLTSNKKSGAMVPIIDSFGRFHYKAQLKQETEESLFEDINDDQIKDVEVLSLQSTTLTGSSLYINRRIFGVNLCTTQSLHSLLCRDN